MSAHSDRTAPTFDFDSIDALFNARSIAVFGASADPMKIGGRPVRFLHEGPFDGSIYPINSRRDNVQGLRAYSALSDIDDNVDLAVLAIPGDDVLRTLEDCAQAGVRAAVVFSAGFAEVGDSGAAAQARIADIARESGMRILGPNCIGAANSAQGVYATFSAVSADRLVDPLHKGVAFVSQSGAVGPHCLTVARTMGLEVPKWATTGNEADLQIADLIAYFAQDDTTRAIAVYMEGCRDGDRLEAALALAHDNGKPVIALKAGRSDIGARAVASHTAALVGSDDVYNAVFEHYGVCRVRTIEELISTSYACAMEQLPSGRRIGIFTGSGGVGILMTDYAEELGLDVAELPDRTQQELLELWPPAGVRNPIDTTAQATNDPDLFRKFLEGVANNGRYDSIVIFLTYLGLLEPWAQTYLQAILDARRKWPEIYFAVSWLATPEINRGLGEAGIASYTDPAEAVAVVSRLAKVRESLDRPLPDRSRPAAPTYDGRAMNEREALQLLELADVPVVPTRLATSASNAVRAAEELGFPVVLKVASAEIEHKSDVGGVAVNLGSAEEVTQAYAQLIDRVNSAMPDVELDGVVVAPMVSDGVETIIGVYTDPAFGPVIVFGFGGVMVDVISEVEYALAPVSTEDAEAMIRSSKGFRLLTGPRGTQAVDLRSLAETISAVSRFAAANAETISSIDLNPVIAGPDGAIAVDALIVPRGQ